MNINELLSNIYVLSVLTEKNAYCTLLIENIQL